MACSGPPWALLVFCQVPTQRPDTPSVDTDGAVLQRDSNEEHPQTVSAKTEARAQLEVRSFMALENRRRSSEDKRRRKFLG